MAKGKELPSVVPSAAKPSVATTAKPAAPRRRRPTVTNTASAFLGGNTIQSDPASIAELFQAQYGWDDPSVEPTEPSPAAGSATPPAVPAASQQQPAAAAKPAGPQHSAVSLYQAKRIGISEAEIESSTPAELDKLVLTISRLQDEHRRDAVIRDGLANTTGARAAAAVEQSPVTGSGGATLPAAESASAADSLPWGKDEESGKPWNEIIHPSIVAMFEHMHGELKSLRQTASQLAQAEAARGEQTQVQQLDGCFASNPELFGSAPGSGLANADPNKQKMLAVVTVMKQFTEGSVKDRYERAIAMLYNAKPGAGAATSAPAPAQNALPAAPAAGSAKPPQPRDPETQRFVPIHDPETDGGEVERWQQGGSAVPTSRPEPAAKGRNAATSSVTRLLRDNPELLGDGGDSHDYSGEFVGSNGTL